MPALAQIYESITADLEKVCQIFDDELFSELPFVNQLCTHVRQYRGKMLRPALLLLSAKSCGQVKPEHHTLAAVVEMVHMATLVHDDVLDEADLRRRCQTVNQLQGNEAAVLLGDYLISHAFHLCSSLDSQYASRVIGSTTNTVCEGELQQVHHRNDYGVSVEQYLQIITRKTAALTGTCCQLGAHFASGNIKHQKALERYGINIGIAFQITDDVLDIVGSQDQMGKTLGRDWEKSKLTLPIIHCLKHSGAKIRERLANSKTINSESRADLRNLLESTGSVDYAMDMAKQYVESAVEALQVIPPSEARDILQRMARLILEREQ